MGESWTKTGQARERERENRTKTVASEQRGRRTDVELVVPPLQGESSCL